MKSFRLSRTNSCQAAGRTHTFNQESGFALAWSGGADWRNFGKHLGDNKFSEAAILKLGSLKTLKLLSLDDSQISANGLKELEASLPNCAIKIWDGRKAANADGTRR